MTALTGRLRKSLFRNATKCDNKKCIEENDRRDVIEKVDFSLTQVFLQWSLGIYVSTPLIAMLQGSFLLNDYRVNYSDAPKPLTPSRGVAIAIDKKEEFSYPWIFPFCSKNKNPPGPSLRLLVVGDSLACGVGISNSGIPILPESIARALSKELNGRPVYWDCFGTPGVSASQIVNDINQIEPYDPHPKGRQLERIVKDFQKRRRRWQQRHNRLGMNDKHDPGKFEKQEKTRNLIYEWFKLVEEDISAIKDIVLSPLPKLDDVDDEYYYDYYRENIPEGETSNISDVIPLVRKGTFFRRLSVNPEAASEYDIAVVLTGLNDVKEIFTQPHLNVTKSDGQTFGYKLRQVLKALRCKMRKMDLETNENSEINSQDLFKPKEEIMDTTNIRRPLVVVPELPVAPLEIFQLVPLCWFLVPIFRAMENNKRFLASCFPDYVVFVHQPDLHWWTDTEIGIGSIRENIKQEQLLLRVTDSAKGPREKLEGLMKKFYDAKDENNDEKIYYQKPSFNANNEIKNHNTNKNYLKPTGNELVSVDKMHPNDEGYELWGRHIAAAIIGHWNKSSRDYVHTK